MGWFVMRDFVDSVVIPLFQVLAFMFLGFVIGGIIWGDDYRQGQIDALTGRVKYELKEQPDKSVRWVAKQ